MVAVRQERKIARTLWPRTIASSSPWAGGSKSVGGEQRFQRHGLRRLDKVMVKARRGAGVAVLRLSAASHRDQQRAGERRPAAQLPGELHTGDVRQARYLFATGLGPPPLHP
ncbi:MAG: hypothetical protein NVS2B4_11300 [Ramlibacter sp.]